MAPRAHVKIHDWQRQGPRFRYASVAAACQPPRARPMRGCTDLTTYLRGDGAGRRVEYRATGRLLGVDKDTANHGLPVLGQHCQSVMNYFFRNLHLLQCQLDELWTFIQRRKTTDLLGETGGSLGDAWVWIAFSPVANCARLGGREAHTHARRLFFRLQSATDGHIPFFPSDALPHYASAVVGGVWCVGHTAPARDIVWTLAQPRRSRPPDICYLIVLQERAHGRVVVIPASSTGPPCRSKRPGGRRLSATRSIHMGWSSLPDDPQPGRMGRKVNASRQLQTAWNINSRLRLRTTTSCPTSWPAATFCIPLPTKGDNGSL